MASHKEILNEPLLNSASESTPSEHNSPEHSSHSGDSSLEKVLSDTRLPASKRLREASWIELKLLFRLATPAVLVYLINNAMSLSTRIFAGHLGNLELAAASLGNSGIQLFAYGLMCGGDSVRASIRSTKIRNARRVSSKSDSSPPDHSHSDHRHLCLIEADPALSRRANESGFGGGDLRLRSDPADIRVRGELPDPEVPAGAEHCDAEHVHIGGDAAGARADELGGGVQAGAGAAWGVAGAELVVVDHSWGSVLVHLVAMQVDLDWLQFGGLLWPLAVLQLVGCVGGDALLGDLVLSDSGVDCWIAREP
ncbi:hypothetical protein TIFTF001_019035 [Ficus carica]|uniref:Uncharacterized protein n=1 Tax=Ficus carica TaxID=3494 RepID=A0AA88DC92_FICCA|nr:hypothetical protein TIFTF001_019035 [Ficus carica]